LKSEVPFKCVDNIIWLPQKKEKEMMLSRNVHSWSHTIMSEGSLNMKCRRLTCSYKNIGQLLQVAFILCFRPLLFSSEKKGRNFVKTCPNVIRGKKSVKCCKKVSEFEQASNHSFSFFFKQNHFVQHDHKITLFFVFVCLSTITFFFCFPNNLRKHDMEPVAFKSKKEKAFWRETNFCGEVVTVVLHLPVATSVKKKFSNRPAI